jgi:hypothetical protein
VESLCDARHCRHPVRLYTMMEMAGLDVMRGCALLPFGRQGAETKVLKRVT